MICWTSNNAQPLVINDMVLSMMPRLYFISTYCFSSPYSHGLKEGGSLVCIDSSRGSFIITGYYCSHHH